MPSFGWHAETAIHVLRLVLSGTLDKFPRLKLLIGHIGEMMPVMMDRFDKALTKENTHSTRTVSQTIRDQVFITTSGFFTAPLIAAAIATFGLDNMLFSIDYPFVPSEPGHQFLANVEMVPADIVKIACGNADRLLGL